MMSTLNWIADAVLVLLLIGTLAMAIRLDRALKVVHCNRESFEALISNLGSATGSVKVGIQALRAEAEKAAEQIGRRSDEADKIATDLSFLIDSANHASARLESALAPAPTLDVPGESDASAAEVPEPVRTRTHTTPSAISSPVGGLRELVGIATKHRKRNVDTSVHPQHADQDVPKTDGPRRARRGQRPASNKMVG